MNELITSNALTMSSQEIAELTGKRHDHVMRDIRTMLVELHGEEGIPTFGDTHRNPQNGQEYPIFRLPKRETLILVSGYNLQMRARIIDRWQALEAHQMPPAAFVLPDFSNPAIAARAWAEQFEEKAQLALENRAQAEALAVATPKARAFDQISAGEKALTITQAAKVLGVKREELTNWLHANGWIYRQNGSWVAYEQHIRNGRLRFKEARYTDDVTGQEVYRPYCHITPKGLTLLAEQFALLKVA